MRTTTSQFRNRSLVLIVLACTAAVLAIRSSQGIAANAAWSFEPEPFEWQVWPEYCRIQWTRFSGGRNPKGDFVYSEGNRNSLRQVIGIQTYEGLHHWCAGQIYLARSKVAAAMDQKRFLLKQAEIETEFTLTRAETNSPVYPNMAITLAQVRLATGKSDEAIAILQDVIRIQPMRLEPYVTLANIYLTQKNQAEARKTVLSARQQIGSASPELHYNLGLLSLQVGDVPGAIESAQIAYANGHPLQGLKNKLIRLGKWKDEYAQKK
jgi:tetratricopeptide (TPR) repeat protein